MASSTQEKELVELERQYWHALQEGDVDGAIALTDFPVIVTGPQGIGRIDEQGYRVMMKKSPYSIERFKMGDPVEVRLVNDDVAIVAYKVHEELNVGGEPVTVEATDSSTWVRRDGKWRCAHHTEALMGDPFGRDRGQA
jgi:ketosteroid isomerase-like protein